MCVLFQEYEITTTVPRTQCVELKANPALQAQIASAVHRESGSFLQSLSLLHCESCTEIESVN